MIKDKHEQENAVESFDKILGKRIMKNVYISRIVKTHLLTNDNQPLYCLLKLSTEDVLIAGSNRFDAKHLTSADQAYNYSYFLLEI